MTIAVKRYTSAMTSAPSLTGQVGSLVSLLDACLINGFNPQTVTLTQTAGTATASCSSHGFNVNDVVVISGANESAWNNEFRVLTAATNSFTFAIASGTTSPATGTITAKIAPLGWTKPYSGTNKAAYLPQVSYVQCYLRVLDDSTVPGSADGRWAMARGYETMSDVDTGTGLFPTTAQYANGLFILKSTSSDAVARSWWLAGDGGIFYFTAFNHQYYPSAGNGNAFGDINSLVPGDAYGCCLFASNTSTADAFSEIGSYLSTQSGKYVARNYTQTGTSTAAGMMGDLSVSSVLGIAGFPYPNPPNNGLVLTPVSIVESGVLRSQAMPGLYQPLHDLPLTHLNTVTDIPGFPNRTFQAFDLSNGSGRAQCLIDITGPWR